MTDNILKLAAFAHELLNSAPVKSDQLHGVETMLSAEERARMATLFSSISESEINQLTRRALALLAASAMEPVKNALGTAIELVEDAPRQQSNAHDLINIAFELTALGGALSVGILLASRIARIRGKTFEITFFEGVPAAAEAIIKDVTGSAQSLTKVIEKVNDEQPSQSSKGKDITG